MRTRARVLLSLIVAAATAAALMAVPASPAAASSWVPPNGFMISNPLGSHAEKYKIQDRVVRMINSVPAHEFIRISSWNIESRRVTDALVRAHRRGVTVRVLMDESNLPQNPNFKYMQRQLKGGGNLARPAGRRSIAKTCNDTCRGGKGAMHTKVFLFSEIGGRRNIVMHGAANLTQAIVDRQWTDMVTIGGPAKPYLFWLGWFNSAWADHYRKYQNISTVWNDTIQEALPFRGPHATASGDFPVLKYLKMTKCRGTAGAGYNNRTVIRIGIASIRNDIGLKIARRLKFLWDQGCNIRILYAVMGGDIYRKLREPGGRGKVPMRHIVSDPNHDGLFDKYLHTKYVAISGYVGRKRNMEMTIMGSPNWSSLSMISDENMARYFRKSVNRFYWRFTDKWFMNPPANNRIAPSSNLRGAAPVDPYALMKQDLGEDMD